MITEKEFNRYSIAAFDWGKSLSYAKEARNHMQNHLVYEALLLSAIVRYYSPFSQNEKDKGSSAASSLCIEDLSPLLPHERQMHESCKHLRNKALAHSEVSFNPTRYCRETGVIASRPFSLQAQTFELEEFIKLVTKLELRCHHKRADYVHEQRCGLNKQQQTGEAS